MPIRDSGGDIQFGVKITADGSVYVDGVRAATKATDELKDSLKKTGDQAGESGKAHESLTGAVVKGTAVVDVAKRAWEGMVDVYREVIDHTLEAQQAQLRMEAILRATGGAAGQTAQTIGQLATEMSKTTAFDDTAIKNASTALLTFDKISGDTFPRVIKLAADLAASGRGDIGSWIQILGRVGQEPVQSMGALERQIGKLDPALKTMARSLAEAGDKQGALNVVLNELDSRVGGTAQTVYSGLALKIGGVSKAWDDLLRTMGNEVFSVRSKDASIFEVALNKLSYDVKLFADGLRTLGDAAKNVPDWVLTAMGLGGVVPMRHVPGQGAPQTGIAGEIQRLQAAIAAGKSYDGDTRQLEQQLRVAQARLAAQQAANAPAATVGSVAAPGNIPSIDELLTPGQKDAIRMQELDQEKSLIDSIYKARADGVQREIALEGQKHDKLLESDSDYYAKVGALEQRLVVDDIARIKNQIALENQELSLAGTQLLTARKNPDPTSSNVEAALAGVEQHKAKINELNIELASSEAKWDDARNKASAQQYVADVATLGRLTDIGRFHVSINESIQKRLQPLQKELESVGKTAEEVRIQNEQEALAVEYRQKRLEIEQKIDDLNKSPLGHEQEIQKWQDMLMALPDDFATAMGKVAGTVKEIFSRQRAVEMFSGLVGAMSDTFKSGWDAVVNRTGSAARAMRDTFKREFFDWLYAQFAKPFVLNVIAGVAGAGGIGATGLAQAATTAAGGNTIGSGFGSLAGSAIGSAGSYLFGSTLASSSAPLAIDGIGTVAASATFETAGVTGMSGGLMSGLTSALSAIPVWGWIALAVIAAIGYFMGQGGGPKWGGSAGGSFGPNGQYLGASGATGTENGRLYTPNGADADMQKVVDAAGQGFFKALAGLHGTSAGIGVSFGYDTDPSGSAGTRLSDQVRDSQGNILYENINQSVDKDKMPDAIALELERGILAGLQHSDFENATMKAILNSVLPKDATTDQIDTVIKLATAYQQLGDAINAVTASGPEKIAKTIKDLTDAVDTAGQNMDLALGTGDNAKILDAEQTLFAAVMNRYNTELQMVEQLRQNIRSVEEASYQFAISIAGKINSVGGSRDIGGIALGRANDLKGNIGGSEPIDLQVQDINSYVGAIDTWYQSRAAQIQADAERQAAAENAASQAGAAAAQAQVAALQQQLDLAMKWKDVLDKAGQMINDMKLSSTNPLGIEGRTTLAQGDVQTLLASYQGATGQGKIDLAGQLMDALKTYSSLGQQAFDRPSDNWQAIYNEIQRDLTAIQGDAKDPAEQAVSLQQQILAAQQEANGWASATANASDIAATGMASLNEEALGYYTWAEENGTKLYDQQRQTYIDQLNAITGGVNVDLFIADLNKQMLEALKSIDARMAAAFPGTSATTGGTDTGGGPTGGGGDGSDVVTQKRGTTIVINTTASDPVQAVLANATRIKRALENA